MENKFIKGAVYGAMAIAAAIGLYACGVEAGKQRTIDAIKRGIQIYELGEKEAKEKVED